MTYTVDVGGRHLVSGKEGQFTAAGLDGHFAFKVDDLGGILGIGAVEGDFVTRFSYDRFGRRQLAQQTFTHAGTSYEATYPTVTFDAVGRLSGYQAVLKTVPAK